eukprot:6193739-Pleurochrysis_carterae.AAC.6
MGHLDVNKVSPVDFNELSRVPLRPSRVILIAPSVIISCTTWPNISRLAWEPRYKARRDRKCTMALSVFMAGSVNLLATEPRVSRQIFIQSVICRYEGYLHMMYADILTWVGGVR